MLSSSLVGKYCIELEGCKQNKGKVSLKFILVYIGKKDYESLFLIYLNHL